MKFAPHVLAAAQSHLVVIDVQEKLLPAMADSGELLRNLGILIESARTLGVPVTVSEQYPEGLGSTVPPISAQVDPQEIVAKVEFSCLASPVLAERLSRPERTLILTGIEAHICVQQTALAAVERGIDVAVVADAVASRKPASAEIGLRRLAAAGVQIVTTEMVVFEWLGTKANPAFKALSRLVR